jgi:uncharacterized membrane protein YdjX (TVP38/TMEM64 family)
LTGAWAAALGRFALAHGFRLLGGHIPEKMKRNLAVVRKSLEKRKRSALIGLGLFALSPVPSAQLFEAAGLSRMPIGRFTLAFFVGRTISYSIYALSANGIAHSSVGEAFQRSFTTLAGVAVELAMIALLVAFTQIDWEKRLGGEDASR